MPASTGQPTRNKNGQKQQIKKMIVQVMKEVGFGVNCGGSSSLSFDVSSLMTMVVIVFLLSIKQYMQKKAFSDNVTSCINKMIKSNKSPNKQQANVFDSKRLFGDK